MRSVSAVACLCVSVAACASVSADGAGRAMPKKLPEQCDMSTFPRNSWDAKPRADEVLSVLDQIEQGTTWAAPSSKAFRDSLQLCDDKFAAYFGSSPASGTHTYHTYWCQTILACTRINVLLTPWSNQ